MSRYAALLDDTTRPVPTTARARVAKPKNPEVPHVPPHKAPVPQESEQNRPLDQPTNRPTDVSINQPTNESTKRSTKTPENRVVDRPKAFYITERLDRRL